MGLYLPKSCLPRPAELQALRATAEGSAGHEDGVVDPLDGRIGELDALRGGPFLQPALALLRDCGIALAPADRRHLDTREAFARLLLNEGLEMAARLESDGIPVILLKGAALVASGLVRPSERAITDVDLLVPPDCRDLALRILGVEVAALRVPIGDTPEALRHSCGATSPAGFPIDLHWFVNRHCRWGRADNTIWEHAVAGEFLGRLVRFPPPEDLVVLSVAHGTRKDSETRLWAWDVAAILLRQGASFDWNRVVEVAACYRLEPVLAAALRWLRVKLALPIPAEVTNRLGAARLSVQDTLFLWLTQSRVDYTRLLNRPFRYLDAVRNRRGQGVPGERSFS